MSTLIFKFILPVLLWSASLQGSITRRAYVEHERHDWQAFGHKKHSDVKGSLVFPVRVHLTQRNLDAGHDSFMDISDPRSPRFGKHWSKAQVLEFFKPAQHTIDSVLDWIEGTVQHDKIRLSLHKQWFGFNSSISNLEKMLKTKFNYYETPDGALYIACDRYFIPATIQDHVDYITPGIVPWYVRSSKLGKRKPSRNQVKSSRIQEHQVRDASHTALNSSCTTDGFTPACIQQLYNVNDTVPTGTQATIGIYNAALEVYLNQSLQTFFQNYATNIPTGTYPTYISIDGAPGPGSQNINTAEADLDVDMVYPLVYPAKVVEYGVDDRYYQNLQSQNFASDPYHGLFNNFLDALDGSYCNYTAFGITGNSATDPVYPDTHNGTGTYSGQLQCGLYQATDVITFSYSIGESVTPFKYQKRQCNEWMKLGMQGVSLIFDSGDNGVGQYGGVSGDGCFGGTQNAFGPNAPSNCPYVTSVGGTDNGKTTAWSGSGGGFSNIFPTPNYQQTAVNNWFTNHGSIYTSYNVSNQNTPGSPGKYNRNGRGYPDVAALATNAIFVDGGVSYSDGTSASAPIVAGIITRINAARRSAGKSPIGFLNQIFYQNTGMFTDVTSGNNPACNTTGFNAVSGWDPVTGLGSPNYPQMKSVLLALP